MEDLVEDLPEKIQEKFKELQYFRDVKDEAENEEMSVLREIKGDVKEYFFEDVVDWKKLNWNFKIDPREYPRQVKVLLSCLGPEEPQTRVVEQAAILEFFSLNFGTFEMEHPNLKLKACVRGPEVEVRYGPPGAIALTPGLEDQVDEFAKLKEETQFNVEHNSALDALKQKVEEWKEKKDLVSEL